MEEPNDPSAQFDDSVPLGMDSPPMAVPTRLDEQEKALKKGRGRMLVAAAIGIAGAIGGLAFLVLSQQPDQYGTIGRQINGMKAEHFDPFWSCALPGTRLSQIRSDQDLRYEINKRAETSPDRYARHVNQECMVRLNEHEPPSQLIAPEELTAQLSELDAALVSLRESWSAYLNDLDRLEGPYREEEFDSRLHNIAKGWYDYRHAHSGLNTAIRDHLE